MIISSLRSWQHAARRDNKSTAKFDAKPRAFYTGVRRQAEIAENAVDSRRPILIRQFVMQIKFYEFGIQESSVILTARQFHEILKKNVLVT